MRISDSVYDIVVATIMYRGCSEGRDWLNEVLTLGLTWQEIYDRAPADWLVWLADAISWGSPGNRLWWVFEDIDTTDRFWNAVVKWLPDEYQEEMIHSGSSEEGGYEDYMYWLADVIRGEIPTVEEFLKLSFGGLWDEEWEIND